MGSQRIMSIFQVSPFEINEKVLFVFETMFFVSNFLAETEQIKKNV